MVRTLSYFIAISSVNHLCFMGTRLVLVLYAVNLQASPVVVGLIAGLFGAVSAFVSVPAGRVMDRIGPGRPMLWCSSLMVAGAMVGVLWRDIPALFVVSIVVGTFYSLFFVGHTQWVGKIGGPENRVNNVSLAALGFSFATFIGPMAAGYVIDHFGHALALYMLGLVPMFSVAVLAFKVIEAPPGSGQSAAERDAGGKRSIKDLLRDKELRKVYMVCVIASSTWSIVSLLIPLYGLEIGLSASTIGLILGAYSFASIVIRVFMTQLARRFTGWQQMLLSLGLAGVSFIFLPLVTQVAGLMMVAFLIGLGMGLAGPLSQNLLYDVSPPGRVGEVMGLRVTVMNTTSTAIPLASGSLSAAVGVSPIFWIIALVLLGGVWSRRAQWKLARPIHPALTKASGKDRAS